MVPRTARCATWAYFFLGGAGIAVWVARIPTVKHQLGLTDGKLAVAMMAGAAGALVATRMVGRLVDRFGSAAMVNPSGMLFALVLAGPGLAPNLPLLVVALFVLGGAAGLLDVAMNVQAVLVERAYGRPIMTSFHAAWSVAGLVGSAAGGAAAAAGLGPGANLGIAGCVLGLLALVAGRGLLPGRPPLPTPAGEPARPRPRTSAAVLFLGVLGMCCFMTEGSAGDWSAVYLRDDLGTSAAFAPAAFAAFSISMTGGRLLGDRLAARLGPVRLVQACGLLAGAGLGGALLVGRPLAAVIGFGVLGAGLSCIVPQLFTAAGNLRPERAGRDLAQVASLSYAGMLIGPLTIGGAASLAGLPAALVIPVALSLLVAASARALRPGGIR